jgi:hypothetical protein
MRVQIDFKLWIQLLFALHFIALPGRAPTTTDSKKLSTSSSYVDISGGLSGSEVRSGRTVLFWVTIQNDSEAILSDVSVQIDVARDEFAVTCLSDGSGSDSKTCGPRKDPIAKNQAITLRGELRDTGPRNINAIVSFNSSVPELRGTVLSVRAVLMGTLVGRSTFMALFLTYKDLLLPFVIAVFGGILAARQAQIQTQRAQIGETWNKMLPISHKLALRYYMPMIKALLRVFEDAKGFTIVSAEARAEPTDTGLSVYFHTMSFWWRYKRTQDKAGAIYFKNRTGEKVVIAAFQELRVAYKGQGVERFAVERRLTAILRLITNKLEYPEFKLAFDTPPETPLRTAFNLGWPDFVAWYSDDKKRKRSFAVLEVFKIVLDFETNRPYERWYNGVQELQLCEDQKAVLLSLAETNVERAEFTKYISQAGRGKG